MSRILSFPHISDLKLFHVSHHIHMASLRGCFQNLSPNNKYVTKYQFTQNGFILSSDNKQSRTFLPEDDTILIRSLRVFQKSMDIPYDTSITIQAKRRVVDNSKNVNLFDEHKHWKTYGQSKIGIFVVSNKNILGGHYEFRDKINNYYYNGTDETVIKVNEGQMICYTENNLVEHRLTPIITFDNITNGIRDEIIFST